MVEPRIGQSNAITINRQINNPNTFSESWRVSKIAGNRRIESAMLQDSQIEFQRVRPGPRVNVTCGARKHRYAG